MKVIKYTFTFSFFVLLACQVKQKKSIMGRTIVNSAK